MDNATPAKPVPPAPPLHYGAGLLSYLVPGLGQIAQGRVGKGVLFLVCIYALFFYGVYLGAGSVTLDGKTYRVSSNVYLPDEAGENPRERQWPALAQNLYTRPQFAGQFFVGIAAWPAIVQYVTEDDVARLERELQSNKFADPDERDRKQEELSARKRDGKRGHPVLGDFMRQPSPEDVNAVTNAGDKRMELAWVYTVIAGVLNILVIYDAVAGPMYGACQRGDKKE